MRLIDADELKKAIHTYENRKLPLDIVIDNAPTVDESYKAGYIAGIHDAIRPQGKWLDIYESHIAYQCSNCKRQMPVPSYFKFCPNCGAEMVGGEE